MTVLGSIDHDPRDDRSCQTDRPPPPVIFTQLRAESKQRNEIETIKGVGAESMPSAKTRAKDMSKNRLKQSFRCPRRAGIVSWSASV